MNTVELKAHRSNCAYCAARPIGVCGALGDGEAFHELRDARRGVRILDAGAAVYRQGDPTGEVLNLVSGWVVQYQDLEDGRRQVLNFLLPGAMFGHEPAGMNGMGHGAEALTNASLCVVPSSRMSSLRASYPDFNERYLWMLERDARLGFDHLASLGQRHARERVAHLLLELTVRMSGRFPLAEGDKFQLPLTQPLIAAATGLTAIHVNRMLRQLRDDGILDFRNRRLTVIDPRRLEATAGVTDSLVGLWTRPGAATSASISGRL